MDLPGCKKRRRDVPILGREAHAHESKVGRSWKPILETKYDEDGYPCKIEYKGPAKCPHCDSVIRYDARGYAVCDCGLIWNEGVPLEQAPRPDKLRTIKAYSRFVAKIRT